MNIFFFFFFFLLNRRDASFCMNSISDIYVYLIVTSLKRRVNSCQEVLYVPDRGAVDAVA